MSVQRALVDHDRARVRFLEALFARLQHDAATPLLTASGFARIAAEAVTGEGDPVDAIDRVGSGVERARDVLATAARLVASDDVRQFDLVEVVEEAAATVRASGTAAELSLPDHRVGCFAEAAVLRELAAVLVELVASRSRGDQVAVEVDASGPNAVVLTLSGGGPWSVATLAALDAATSARLDEPAANRGSAAGAVHHVEPGADPDTHGAAGRQEALVARAARLAATQLAVVWLDRSTPGRLTLRLLAATPLRTVVGAAAPGMVVPEMAVPEMAVPEMAVPEMAVSETAVAGAAGTAATARDGQTNR